MSNQATPITDWILTDPDDYQWQRKIGDTYEMYQVIEFPPYVECRGWYAGGGTFKLDNYDQADHDWALCEFGYDTWENLVNEYGDDAEGVLAECLFECNWADWDLYTFDTEAEAIAFVDELIETAEKGAEMHYYAQHCPYGTRTMSLGDELRRYDSKELRDKIIDSEIFGDDYHITYVSSETARRWYPKAFAKNAEWKRLDDHCEVYTGRPTGGSYADID